MSSPNPTISLCMIVRDEERFLASCLESVKGVADEIIVADTGSRDSTVEIAQRFGARVVHHPWDEDFAAARNRALAAATGGWILTLDADERLDPQTAPAIRRATAAGDWDSGYLRFINMSELGPCGREWLAVRVFRRTPGLRYIGRIHEQIVHTLPQLRTRVIDAVVYHYGYQASVYAEKQKQARNLRMLERALEDPEARDPLLRSNYLYHRANLATDRELLDRYRQFESYVRENWPDSPPSAPWITAGLAEYARLLNDVGRSDEARRLAEELLERHGESPSLRYILARAAAAGADLEAAEQELQRVLAEVPEIASAHQQYSQDVPLVRGRARYLLGLIREKQGRLDQAVPLFQAAVEEEPEQDLFRQSLACGLTRLGRYAEALQVLETSQSLVNLPQPGTDCLGFVLALLTQSVGRLGLWGAKVRQLAPLFPPAANLLERVSRLGPGRRYVLDDFPEIVAALPLQEHPGAVRMPQTSRKSTEVPR